jgi:hypothetical protein
MTLVRVAGLGDAKKQLATAQAQHDKALDAIAVIRDPRFNGDQGLVEIENTTCTSQDEEFESLHPNPWLLRPYPGLRSA